jgi:hypothetical protein
MTAMHRYTFPPTARGAAQSLTAAAKKAGLYTHWCVEQGRPRVYVDAAPATLRAITGTLAFASHFCTVE